MEMNIVVKCISKVFVKCQVKNYEQELYKIEVYNSYKNKSRSWSKLFRAGLVSDEKNSDSIYLAGVGVANTQIQPFSFF